MDAALLAEGRPGEAKQADRFQWRQEQQPLEPALGRDRIVAVTRADLLVAPEPGEVREVGDGVGEVDGDEGPGLGEGAEAPTLLVHDGEALKEGEDKSVRETGQQRQAEDDGLAQQHVEGAKQDCASFLHRDAGLLQFVGAVDVGVLARLATLLGDLIHDDGGAGLGHKEDDKLDGTTEDELNPEEPAPAKDYGRILS